MLNLTPNFHWKLSKFSIECMSFISKELKLFSLIGITLFSLYSFKDCKGKDSSSPVLYKSWDSKLFLFVTPKFLESNLTFISGNL